MPEIVIPREGGESKKMSAMERSHFIVKRKIFCRFQIIMNTIQKCDLLNTNGFPAFAGNDKRIAGNDRTKDTFSLFKNSWHVKFKIQNS